MSTPAGPAGSSFGDRQLAAILFTDVAGFSRLTEENERRTLMLVQRDLKLIANICNEFGGEVLKNTGDGCLVTFRSVEAAVRSALRIQGIIADAAHRLPPEQLLHHRIGIHLGDVFFGKGDVLGNGVNIAARLLGEAEPDGICISQPVYDLVKNRLGIKAVFIGARELKNIRESVPVYRLLLGAAAEEQSGQAAPKPPSKGSRRNMLFAAALVSIAAVAGVWSAVHKKALPAIAMLNPVAPATIPASQPALAPQMILQILQTPPAFVADSAAAWQTFPSYSNPNITAIYENGSYTLTTKPGAYRVGLSPSPWGSFDDATLEATGRAVGDSGSFWAISLLAADGPRKVVRIALSQRGMARIDLARMDGIDEASRPLHPNDLHVYTIASLRRADNFNTLVINVHNHQMTVLANGSPIGDPVDISSLGRTTFSPTVEGPESARAEFQKLRLWLPAAK